MNWHRGRTSTQSQSFVSGGKLFLSINVQFLDPFVHAFLIVSVKLKMKTKKIINNYDSFNLILAQKLTF